MHCLGNLGRQIVPTPKHHATKRYKVHVDMLQSFYSLAVDGDEWTVPHSGRFIPGEGASDSYLIRGWAGSSARLHVESPHSPWK
jgi:hypothetical protein